VRFARLGNATELRRSARSDSIDGIQELTGAAMDRCVDAEAAMADGNVSATEKRREDAGCRSPAGFGKSDPAAECGETELKLERRRR
jgi:hypothetical protein